MPLISFLIVIKYVFIFLNNANQIKACVEKIFLQHRPRFIFYIYSKVSNILAKDGSYMFGVKEKLTPKDGIIYKIAVDYTLSFSN